MTLAKNLQRSVTITKNKYAGTYTTQSATTASTYTYFQFQDSQKIFNLPHFTVVNTGRGNNQFSRFNITIQYPQSRFSIAIFYRQGQPEPGRVNGQNIDTQNAPFAEAEFLLGEYFSNKRAFDAMARQFWYKVQQLPVVIKQPTGGYIILLEPSNLPARVTYPDNARVVQS